MFEIVPHAEASVVTLMKSINRVIINPVIFFLFAVAMVYFLYGLAQYLLSPDNEEVRKKSKAQMIWGIVGLFVMVAVFGIMRIIITTLGVTNVKIQTDGDYEIVNTTKNTVDYTVVDKDRETYNLDTSAFSDAENKSNSTTVGLSKSLGSWNASTNTPKLVSGVGQKGYYYDVLTAGTTNLDGITRWEVGEFAYFDGAKWIKKLSTTETQLSNNLGSWDARANLPQLASGVGKKDNYYIVSTSGTTTLDGIKEWVVGDIAYFDGTKWVKKLSTTLADISNYLGRWNASRNDPLIRSGVGKKDHFYMVYISGTTIIDGTSDWFQGDIIYFDGTKWVKKDEIPRVVTQADEALPVPKNQSDKKSSLIGKYVSNSQFYRAVDSGVHPVLSVARGIAIDNALIEIARQKGLTSINTIVYRVIEERYFAPDENQDPGINTDDNYDYFVAIESPR